MKWNALQQAIYNRLAAASGLTSLLSQAFLPSIAIFTDVPQSARGEDDSLFPYVTIFEASGGPFDDNETIGGDTLVQISIWSRGSMLAARDVMDAADAAMRRQALSIAGANHITTELSTVDVGRDPDGKTIRGTLQYRVLWQVED